MGSEWNGLPEAMVEASTTNNFKNGINKLLKDFHFKLDICNAQTVKALRARASTVTTPTGDN